MTDYSTWKVTELKAELKRRGIAQTGLRVKQQFIDRLLEEDANAESATANGEPGDAQDAVEESLPVEEKQPTPPAADTTASHDDKPELAQEQQQQQQQEEEKETPNVVSGDAQPEEKSTEVTQDVDGYKDKEQEQEQEPPREPEQQPASPPKDAPEQPAEPQPEVDASEKPVEQAPGDEEVQKPTPTDAENADQSGSAEAVAPSAPPASELATGVSTPLPSEELLEDSRKRKRRSQSPIPTPEALANKKAKIPDEAPRVLLPEDRMQMDIDGDSKMEEAAPDSQEPVGERPDDAVSGEKADVPQDESHPTSNLDNSRAKKEAPPKQDARFKGLFAAGELEPARPPSPSAVPVVEESEVEPALHVATAALYVDGLMRPLQPAALKSHLISIASPPGSSPNADVIVDFHLDAIKTHCFVSFTNVAAASRARAALHGTVWPNERNRKSLFVDFIPESKVQPWIETEQNSRGRGGPPTRWEVKYDRTDDGVEAVLEEVGSKGVSHQARGRAPSDFARPPPLGPRADMEKAKRSSVPQVEPSSRPGQGFKPLDELFKSTTTKPKLYYLPVSREIADRRLDRFDDLLNKGEYPRPGGDETRRISFEDGDLFVDHGPEYAARNRRRGGRGRGRGGFGDSWRGGHY
ncbi:hypothetical protein BDV25DRAFT_155267 [Aspergillus avenaceus]|uniref:RRM domain-containing protein n=1 Tax=Aspergillus avenaceus TaxID=36643 RepID=A0A5N6TUF5_ASPAV|nr:hypothetical protein BDV25DRAFT_155267 [Aspergillus avenaceus]